MRDMFFNMNQAKMLEISSKFIDGRGRSKIDLTDFILLRRLGDFILSSKTTAVIKGNQVFHWVHYETIQESLPIVFPTKLAIRKRVDKLKKLGLIINKKHNVKKSDTDVEGFSTAGTYSIIQLSKDIRQLFDEPIKVKIDQGFDPLGNKECHPLGNKGCYSLGDNKEPQERNPKKEKSSSTEKLKPATAFDETFFKNLKELLLKKNFKNYNSQTLKNLENYSNGDLEEIKKVIKFMELKNKILNSKILVAILKDGDHKVVDLKKVTRKEKIAHMLKITFQDEINDLCNQIAKSFGFGEYEKLSKSEENIVNTELENIFCKRYNKLNIGRD